MRLKKFLAEAELDKAMLKELAEGPSDPEPSPGWSAQLRQRFGVSERKACAGSDTPIDPALGLPASAEDEAPLRAFLRAFSTERPRWGWRRAAKALRREGWRVNNKRVQRLWRARGPEGPLSQTQEAPPWHRDRASEPCANRPQRLVGPRLPVRHHRGQPDH